MVSADEISDEIERLRSELRDMRSSLSHRPPEERRELLTSMWRLSGRIAQALERHTEIAAGPDGSRPVTAAGEGARRAG